jgi:Undecaprenyl-phosphate galactose phosphotransferase WbaP
MSTTSVQTPTTQPAISANLPLKQDSSRFFWSLVRTGMPLCLSDVAVVLTITVLIGYGVVAPLWGISVPTLLMLLCGLFMTTPFVCYLYGLYPGVGLNSANELRWLSNASSTLALVYIIATTVQDFAPGTNTLILALSWPCWLVGLPLSRWVLRRRLAKQPWWGLRTIVIGGNSDAQAVYNLLKQSPELGLRATSCVDNRHSCDAINEIAREEDVQHAIVPVANEPVREVLRFLTDGDYGFLQVTVIPSVTEPFDLALHAVDVGGQRLGLVVKQRLVMPPNRWLKRLSDIVAVIVVGSILMPFLLTISLLIKLTSSGPILFKHRRIGKGGKSFEAWKFRTMVPDADRNLAEYLGRHPELRMEWEDDQKLKHDPRVTAIGRLLRRTSLDELPQIWNVLCGEMSLVGPRPIVDDEVAKYKDRYRIYQKVRPGITGLWQVSGRNDTSYWDRVMLDTTYVRNWSLWLDVCILAKTVLVVIRGDGAY